MVKNKSKIFILVIAVLLMVFVGVSNSQLFIKNKTVNAAESVQIDGVTWYYNDLGNGTCEIAKNLYYAGSLTIPEMINNLTVVKVANNAFSSCSGLTSIIIPNSITCVGESAFSSCTNLISVILLNGLTSIEKYAFKNCSNLTNIAIPNTVTSIGMQAFQNCALTSIILPSSVTNLGSAVFVGCSETLTSIIVDKNNIKYDSRNNCNAIIETDTNNLLLGCKNTVIPNGVTSIMSFAFQSCSDLTGIIIPSGVTTIGTSAFKDCSNLTSIVIPKSVTTINGSAFKNVNLTYVYYTGSESEWQAINIKGSGNESLLSIVNTENLHYNYGVEPSTGIVLNCTIAVMPILLLIALAVVVRKKKN